jgi:hypothetical protein
VNGQQTSDQNVQVCDSWCGGPVRIVRGPLAAMRDQLPVFNRRLGGRSGYRITRTASSGEEADVADVTGVYHLVQHRDVVDALLQRLSAEIGDGVAARTAPATMVLGPRECRMDLTVDLPYVRHTPRDGYRIGGQVSVRNSVDKSCALYAGFGFLRWVCSNGMFAWDGRRARKVHNQCRILRAVMDHVTEQLRQGVKGLRLFDALLDRPVRSADLGAWTDAVVARGWGRWDAARVYHVAVHGVYGEPERRTDVAPHLLALSAGRPAAGACAPARNLYHLMHALSYVASRSTPYERRLTRLVQVHQMVEPLLN